jgi:hypothetical protein
MTFQAFRGVIIEIHCQRTYMTSTWSIGGMSISQFDVPLKFPLLLLNSAFPDNPAKFKHHSILNKRYAAKPLIEGGHPKSAVVDKELEWCINNRSKRTGLAHVVFRILQNNSPRSKM